MFLRVLLVYQDESIRLMLGLRLTAHGFSVQESVDLNDALGLLEKNPSTYDIVLLDERLCVPKNAKDQGIEPNDLSIIQSIISIKRSCNALIFLFSPGLYDDDLEILRTGTHIIRLPFHVKKVVARIEDAVEQKRNQRTTSIALGQSIKILFLAANPLDTQRLRIDEEFRTIDFALLQSEFGSKFDIRSYHAVRVTDLQNYLLRHKPDIVHFSGHSGIASEIILEDNNGKGAPVSVRALSNLFSVLKDNIKLVVLNACYSKQQAQAIAVHIACVVGMSNAIGDRAAISFATAFYQALGFGRDVQTAFDLGCVQIDLESLSEQDVPKLITKVNPGSIAFL